MSFQIWNAFVDLICDNFTNSIWTLKHIQGSNLYFLSICPAVRKADRTFCPAEKISVRTFCPAETVFVQTNYNTKIYSIMTYTVPNSLKETFVINLNIFDSWKAAHRMMFSAYRNSSDTTAEMPESGIFGILCHACFLNLFTNNYYQLTICE